MNGPPVPPIGQIINAEDDSGPACTSTSVIKQTTGSAYIRPQESKNHQVSEPPAFQAADRVTRHPQDHPDPRRPPTLTAADPYPTTSAMPSTSSPRLRCDCLRQVRRSWRIPGEVQSTAAYPQFRLRMAAVCKTVGFAYPGSNPGPATRRNTSSGALWRPWLVSGLCSQT